MLPAAPEGELAGLSPSGRAVGALAWAQSSCNATASLRAGAAGLSREELVQVSAFYDADAAAQGLEAACGRALADASRVGIGGEPAKPRAIGPVAFKHRD